MTRRHRGALEELGGVLGGEERGLTFRACHEVCHQVLYMYSVSVANVNIFPIYICKRGKGEYISVLFS